MQSHPNNPKLSEGAMPGRNESQVCPAPGSSLLQGSAPAGNPTQTSPLPEPYTLSVPPAHCHGAADCAAQGLTSCFTHLLLNKSNKMCYMISNLQVGIKHYKF